METRQLRQFVAIAEEGSLSAAAARLGVAQPSLSQLMQTLEREIGVDLVVRTPRGVTLTQAGEVLSARAREIVAATDRALQEVRCAGTDPTGAVSFGFPSSVSMALSVPLVETVACAAPGVLLKPVEAMSGFVRNWLDDGSIDLGVLYEVGDLGHWEVDLLLSETLSVFCAPDAWPFATGPGEAVPLRDVAAQGLVLPSARHGLRQMIERCAARANVPIHVMQEMDGLAQIKSMVARGSGLTILAPAAAHDYVACGELVSAPIVSPELCRQVYLVRNPANPLRAAVREVRAQTLTVVEDLVRRGIWAGRLAAPCKEP